ncbi:hypothetical protein ACFYYI_37970, partial [Streptomyces sp. NPDC002387]|uniref:hypothetical protein n=1 Tax=Streptomyces sp. NPDC002387 TaxID=3364643 RepID=UPI0036BCA3E3
MDTGNYFGRGCVEDFRDVCTCIPHTSGYACEEGSHLAWNAGRFLSEAPSLDAVARASMRAPPHPGMAKRGGFG